jgi:hypothetical protein
MLGDEVIRSGTSIADVLNGDSVPCISLLSFVMAERERYESHCQSHARCNIWSADVRRNSKPVVTYFWKPTNGGKHAQV